MSLLSGWTHLSDDVNEVSDSIRVLAGLDCPYRGISLILLLEICNFIGWFLIHSIEIVSFLSNLYNYCA